MADHMTAEQRARLWDECERACTMLPYGWTIRIELENGAGYASLYNPRDARVSIEYGDDDLAEQVRKAIEVATGAPDVFS